MRVRLRPNGRRQPYFAVRVPGTWDELLKIARERLSSDPSVGGVRLYLPDGAEVFSLDDVDTDDVLAVAFNDAEFEQLGTYTGPSPPSPSPHPPTRPPLPLPPPPPWPLPPMPTSPHPSFPPPQLPPSLLPSWPPELPPWMPPLPHAHIARSPPSSLPSTVTPNFVNTSSVVNASIRQRESAASAPHNSTADAARPDGKLVFNRSSRADANHSHPATLNFSAVALGRVANTTSGTDNDVASVLGALLLLAFGLAAMMSALFVFNLGTNQTGAHSPWLEEVSEDEYGEKDEGAENNPFPLAVELRPNRGKVPSTLVGRAHFYWLRLQQVALSASETSLTIEKAKYGEVPSGCSPAEQSVEMSGPKYETIE